MHAPFASRNVRAAFAAAAGIAAFSTSAQDAPARLGLCAACHGDKGMATAATIPNLAGQNLDYLRNAFAQYKAGARDVAAMRAAASMLSDADAERVLQWYAAQTPAKNGAP